MKICDKCDCETKSLVPLAPEFGEMEVCEACYGRLVEKCVAINERLQRIRDRARQRAFKEWKAEDPLSARARRAHGLVSAMLSALVNVR